jgi:hypothetical protein
MNKIRSKSHAFSATEFTSAFKPKTFEQVEKSELIRQAYLEMSRKKGLLSG